MISNVITGLRVKQPPSNHALAVAFMLLAVTIFGVQDIIVKSLPKKLPLIQITFFRAFFAFIPIFIVAQFQKSEVTFKTQWVQGHVIRSLLNFFALLSFLHSFRVMPMATAYTFTFTCPLFLTLFSAILLKENVSMARWAAVIIGFLGILFILRPSGGLSLNNLYAIGGGAMYGLSLVFVRGLSATDSDIMIVFTFSLLTSILSGILLPWFWVPIDMETLGILICMGIFGGFGQLATTRAMRLAPASSTSPYFYLTLIWGTTFDWLLFNTDPNMWTLVGAGIVIAAGLFLARTERKATEVKA